MDHPTTWVPHSSTALPTAATAERAAAEAAHLFRRTLAIWAGDVLELRRTGFLEPRWTGATLAAPRSAAA